MPYRQDLSSCFADVIGERGLEQSDFDRLLDAAVPALEALRAAYADGTLPLLRLPGERDDLDALAVLAARYRHDFADVVVLGTGGSSLGAKTLYALADRGFGPASGTPRLWFMDNVDPDTFESLFASLNLAHTGFLAISKSGSTAETITQLLVCIDALRVRNILVGPRIAAITQPADNPLRRLARNHGMETLDHDPGIGGRYSVLSLVGLLPAMIAGLDAAAVREGAAEVLAPVLAGKASGEVASAAGAAVSVGLLRYRGVAATVMMPYIDRLAEFGQWYRQLWAESLGKDGTGTTPIRATGAADQHSQLQLYLAGPTDKMYTVVVLECRGSGPAVPADLAADPALDYISCRTMGDLMDAEQRVTIEALVRNQRPVRVFTLARLDERTIGALLMHFMIETIVSAHLLDVHPFDQPAVEEAKVLTKQYLAEGAPVGVS